MISHTGSTQDKIWHCSINNKMHAVTLKKCQVYLSRHFCDTCVIDIGWYLDSTVRYVDLLFEPLILMKHYWYTGF